MSSSFGIEAEFRGKNERARVEFEKRKSMWIHNLNKDFERCFIFWKKKL
jgi:hypothetical protein